MVLNPFWDETLHTIILMIITVNFPGLHFSKRKTRDRFFFW